MQRKILIVFFFAMVLIGNQSCDKDKGECICTEGSLNAGHPQNQDTCFVVITDRGAFLATNIPAPYNTYYDTLGGIYPYRGMPVNVCYKELDTAYALCGTVELPQIEICTLTPNP